MCKCVCGVELFLLLRHARCVYVCVLAWRGVAWRGVACVKQPLAQLCLRKELPRLLLEQLPPLTANVLVAIVVMMCVRDCRVCGVRPGFGVCARARACMCVWGGVYVLPRPSTSMFGRRRSSTPPFSPCSHSFWAGGSKAGSKGGRPEEEGGRAERAVRQKDS